MSAPIVLVPGFWLGAWAWDEVAGMLRADGHDVTALTLPGLESLDTDRSSIHLATTWTRSSGPSNVPTPRSSSRSTAPQGTRATSRVTACPSASPRWSMSIPRPGSRRSTPIFAGDEKPLVWDDLAAEENLDGLSEEQLARFRERAVPVPGALLRDGYVFTDDARRDIPSTIIATGYSAADYQKYANEHPEWSFLAGIPELRDLTWIDLPTSHWPMWSRPAELAAIIGEVARKAGAAPDLRRSR